LLFADYSLTAVTLQTWSKQNCRWINKFPNSSKWTGPQTKERRKWFIHTSISKSAALGKRGFILSTWSYNFTVPHKQWRMGIF